MLILSPNSSSSPEKLLSCDTAAFSPGVAMQRAEAELEMVVAGDVVHTPRSALPTASSARVSIWESLRACGVWAKKVVKAELRQWVVMPLYARRAVAAAVKERSEAAGVAAAPAAREEQVEGEQEEVVTPMVVRARAQVAAPRAHQRGAGDDIADSFPRSRSAADGATTPRGSRNRRATRSGGRRVTGTNCSPPELSLPRAPPWPSAVAWIGYCSAIAAVNEALRAPLLVRLRVPAGALRALPRYTPPSPPSSTAAFSSDQQRQRRCPPTSGSGGVLRPAGSGDGILGGFLRAAVVPAAFSSEQQPPRGTLSSELSSSGNGDVAWPQLSTVPTSLAVLRMYAARNCRASQESSSPVR